ncbi:hypothetical protein OROGR_001346 [Orobanche gracilis]
MGTIHSSSSSNNTRFMDHVTKDEEEPCQKNSLYAIESDDSSRMPMLLAIHSLIRKAIKGLVRNLRSISRYLLWTGDDEDGPILPIQNPPPPPPAPAPPPPAILSINDDDSSLLVQPFLISKNSSTLEKSGIQQVKRDHDETIISVPDLTCVGSAIEETVIVMPTSSAVFIQPIAPRNVEIVMGETEEEKEEENVKIKSIHVVVDEGIRWIKHYNCRHRILLVGEGDFSFSACLARAFGSASSMIATSLDSKDFLKTNYKDAPFNIMELRCRECKIMHGIDASKMANHELLGHLKFDRIIFNFPFAGFFKNLSRESQLRRHRKLVSLFMKNAREMVSENGEIHISHKTNEFHVEWKLESLASTHGLRLIEADRFNLVDYPGYNTKCGFGGGNNFNCNPSKTYKFGLRTVRHNYGPPRLVYKKKKIVGGCT